METSYHFTPRSGNEKTGPMPLTTTSAATCPQSCPFNTMNTGGCYAATGHIAMHWNKVTAGTRGGPLAFLTEQIAGLPDGTLWRHNQAGDLPGFGDTIDTASLAAIVDANAGKRGFTYTHKPMTPTNVEAVQAANAAGFTINLSANNLSHADELAALTIGPVVTVLTAETHGNVKLETPAGRRVVVCPATYRDDVNCKSCGLCQVRDRNVIVGFPAHGISAAKADSVAKGAV